MTILELMNDNVAISVVGDFKYLKNHFQRLYLEIRNVGNYHGPIIVLTTKFCPTFLIKFLNLKNNVYVLRFERVMFSKQAENSLNNLETHLQPNRNKTKKFQWHKLHLFDEKLKQWDRILYLDINMNIHYELKSILEINVDNTFMARADAYPIYDRDLSSQFDSTNKLFYSLKNKYDLSIVNYFQTGVMYFDTKIIDNDTKKEIQEIVENYPISITNEQGVLNLYFIHTKGVFKELPSKIGEYTTYFYWKQKNVKTIITKQLTEQTK